MKIEFLVGVMTPVGANPAAPPPNPAVGDQEVFDDDLVLKRYKNKTPGNGLPQNQQQRLAGTHSGTLTILRVAAANDRFYPQGALLIRYQGTYKFKTVANTPLKKGQVTTRGLLLLASNFNPLDTPVRFAITGGTEDYAEASGQVTEGVTAAEDRLLDFED
jgi:hypothetical protein